MNFKKLLTDILTNSDNLSFSTKRVGGYICLITTIVFGSLRNIEGMTVMAGLTATFFGLTTIDNKTAASNTNSDTAKNP